MNKNRKQIKSEIKQWLMKNFECTFGQNCDVNITIGNYGFPLSYNQLGDTLEEVKKGLKEMCKFHNTKYITKKLKFEKTDKLLEELRDITIKEKEKYFQKKLEKILPKPEHSNKQNKTWNDCLKIIKVYANIQ